MARNFAGEAERGLGTKPRLSCRRGTPNILPYFWRLGEAEPRSVFRGETGLHFCRHTLSPDTRRLVWREWKIPGSKDYAHPG